MLSQLMPFADEVLAAPTPEAASVAFFAGASRFGASYLQTRLYRRPAVALTSAAHFAAGGLVARIAPEGWPGSAAFNYIGFTGNPLLTPIRESRTRYSFGEFAPRGEGEYGPYWEALSEAGIGEALCATSYGARGAIASLHLGFPQAEFAPEEALALQLAGLVLTERLLGWGLPEPDPEPRLTRRERDSIALVAEGKTDWEIAVILGVSEATARFHVDNARRKLGAVNRAQAVARLIHQRLI